MDPAALPAGSSQVRLAQRRFNTEDDDEADTPTEEPARHPTDSASEARHHRLPLRNLQPRQLLEPRMPKGVTEPFIFRFVFAWAMKYWAMKI